MLTKADVDVLRPALGIPPKFRQSIVGHRARRDLVAGDPIRWEDIG